MYKPKVDIIKQDTYRSKPLVNMSEDMIRVRLTCTRNDWHQLKKCFRISEPSVEADAMKECICTQLTSLDPVVNPDCPLHGSIAPRN